MEDNLFNKLSEILDDRDIKIDTMSKEKYSTDWTNQGSKNPVCVLFPRSSEQAIELVKLFNELGIEFIGSGGRTGLSGGCSAINNEAIISFEKMDKILDFDPVESTITVQPGLILKNLQDFAENENLIYPIDFSSSGSCMLGGNVATNAGGIKVVKYGTTSDYVDSLNVVTGDGKEIYEINNLKKNATGPKLSNIFVGSEGSLGLILECKLKLIESEPRTKVCIASFRDLKDLEASFHDLLRMNIFAIEFMNNSSIKSVINSFGFNKIANEENDYLLLEYFDESIESTFLDLLDKGILNDVLISRDSKDYHQLWEYRLRITESLHPENIKKFDIAVPVKNFITLIHNIEATLDFIEKDDLIMFGHIGDGNLHLNINNYDRYKNMNVKKVVYELTISLDGTISAEHGLGFIKKSDFYSYPSHKNMEHLKKLKKVFDPNYLLNPGKLI